MIAGSILREVFYGGAAGGGKSDALLMAALQYVDVPGYSALLLRRTFRDLKQPDALIPRSKAWLLNTDAAWHENDHRWTFPSGATLSFGYLAHEDDVYQYQGAAFQFVGFDELTQFTEPQYLYLHSRVRRPSDPENPLSRVPLRVWAASNPGGKGHVWVRERFVAPDEDRPAERVFIPAKLPDNPSLDQASYHESLANLDPQTRKQLLEGDWDARPRGRWVYDGEALKSCEDAGKALDRARREGKLHPVGGALRIACDWGQHSHVLLLWPLEAGGVYVPIEWVFEASGDVNVNVRRAAEVVAETLRSDEWGQYPIELQLFDASMPGLNEVFVERLRELVNPRLPARGVPFSKFKRPGVDRLRLLASHTRDGGRPILAYSAAGCPVLRRQMHGLEYADEWSGDVAKDDDHGPDALVAGVAPLLLKR